MSSFCKKHHVDQTLTPTAPQDTWKLYCHHLELQREMGKKLWGGIIWYKETLKNNLSIQKKDSSHILLKVKRGIMDCDKDLYICQNHHITKTFILTNSRRKPAISQAEGNVLLCKDFTTRTCSESNIIDTHENNHILKAITHFTPTTPHAFSLKMALGRHEVRVAIRPEEPWIHWGCPGKHYNHYIWFSLLVRELDL